ncbi:hypothetical protein [Lentzea cavernae]|uniref:Uncharacterized protein n=1 Tax=Lentzea cavernae TaxID=2020703 RepID=A0ABQ3MS64_9PSEU|nr:hypothetical protein [Lentzea cavernae]GHH50507.1 hypothetical protein GCM10017774_59530 [Lentzea cavernae]
MNDFLMAAASATDAAPDSAALEALEDAGLGATAHEQAEAEVPSSSERTSFAREGGPLDSIIPAGTDSSGADQPSAAEVSPLVKTVLTANPNRTKASIRQEVDR